MKTKIALTFISIAAIANTASSIPATEIHDLEFSDYLFALICAMTVELGNKSGVKTSSQGLPDQITKNILYAIKTNSDLRNNGWVLDPGKYSNHHDWSYAGYTSIESLGCQNDTHCIPAKRPVDTIGHDVSHFTSKWSTFLDAIAQIQLSDSNSDDVQELKKRFWNQLKYSVIDTSEEAPTYRLRNFMDGSNGLYRWNYQNRGASAAYLPYEATAALFYSSISLVGCGNDCLTLFQTISEQSEIYIKSPLSKKAGYHKSTGKIFWMLEADHAKGQHKLLDSADAQSFPELFHMISPSPLTIKTCENAYAYSHIVGPKYFLMTQILESNNSQLTKRLDSSVEYCIDRSSPPNNTTEYYYMHRLLYELRWAIASSSRNPNTANKVYHSSWNFIQRKLPTLHDQDPLYHLINKDNLLQLIHPSKQQVEPHGNL